jgi:hypothetical protein
MTRFDLPLWFTILAMEVALVGILLRGRIYRILPIFSVYLVWTIISDVGMLIVQRFFGNQFFRSFTYEMPMDCIMQFGVLVELSWSVLRPVRSVLPRWSIFAIAILILAAGAAVWPLAGFTIMHGLPLQFHFLLRLQQTFSILRILFFVVLAAGSQLLSLGWRDRELQVATGLGFYSLVSLAVSLLHAQMPAVAHYHRIDQLMPVSYLCSLVYWAFSFAQNEAPRQEFTPQMRSFLLKVSGATHAGRIALQDSTLRGDGSR